MIRRVTRQTDQALSQKPSNPGVMRLNKDKESLGDLPDNTRIESLPDETEFRIFLAPEKNSLWHGAQYTFFGKISANYAIEPPKLRLEQNIFHPNFDHEGNICLNILREDWSPIFNLFSIVAGLNSLFDSPKPNDPLNVPAGQLMRESPSQFKNVVRRSLQGQSYQQEVFPRFL